MPCCLFHSIGIHPPTTIIRLFPIQQTFRLPWYSVSATWAHFFMFIPSHLKLRCYILVYVYIFLLQVISCIPFSAYYLKETERRWRQSIEEEVDVSPFSACKFPFKAATWKETSLFHSFSVCANVLLCKCKINLKLSRLNRDCHCGNCWPCVRISVCLCEKLWETIRCALPYLFGG